MSFLSDLVEGNWSNLGTDISHAPSSLANHPTEIAELLGGAGLALGGAGALGLLGDVGVLGGAAAGAGDLGAAAGAGDIALGGDLATSLGIGDITGAAAADLASTLPAEIAPDALAFLGSGEGAIGGGIADVVSTDLASFAPDLAGSLTSDLSAIPTDAAGGLTQDVGAAATDASGAATGPADATAGAATTDTANASTAAPGATTTPANAGTVSATTTPSGAIAPVGQGGTAAPPVSGGAVAPPAGGGGFMGTLNSIVSSPITKLAVGLAPLALTLGMGEQQLPGAAQALQGQALQMQTTGLQNLAQAQAGILNPGQTALLSQNRQNLENQWRQTLYNQGVTDVTKDSRWPEIQAQIDQQITAQTAQLIQQNITNALAETGQASSALTSIANMQMTADQNFTNNLIGATKAAGLAFGMGGGFKLTPA